MNDVFSAEHVIPDVRAFFGMQESEFDLNVADIDVKDGLVVNMEFGTSNLGASVIRSFYLQNVYARAVDAGVSDDQMHIFDRVIPFFTMGPTEAQSYTMSDDVVAALEKAHTEIVKRTIFDPLDEFFRCRFNASTMTGVFTLQAYKALYFLTAAYSAAADVYTSVDSVYAFPSDWSKEMLDVFFEYAEHRHGLKLQQSLPLLMPFIPDVDISCIPGLNAPLEVVKPPPAPPVQYKGTPWDTVSDDVRQSKVDALMKTLRKRVFPSLCDVDLAVKLQEAVHTLRVESRMKRRNTISHEPTEANARRNNTPVIRYIFSHGFIATSHIACLQRLMDDHGLSRELVLPVKKRTASQM